MAQARQHPTLNHEKTLFFLLAYPLFIASAYAEDEWEQCSILNAVVTLKIAGNQGAKISKILYEKLSASHQRTADKNPGTDFSENKKQLYQCIKSINLKISDTQIDGCFISIINFPIVFGMRQQSLGQNVARSINVESDKKTEESIQFIYARPVPERGQGLSDKWRGEWMQKCILG